MKGRICIVDHDLGSRGFLMECLEKEGHKVVTLESGYQIKPLLSQGDFGIFILNIESPGVREKDLLLEIGKKHRARVLLIVSVRGDAFLKEAMDSGVYGFIYKPFNHEEVCTMVSHLSR